MDIIMGSKNSGSDKLDGEFHVPFSYGKGSNKHKWVVCVNCDNSAYLGINASGFICRKCKEYNSDIAECEKKFIKLYEEGKLFDEGAAHVVTSEVKEMVALRDTMNIKADLFAKGITKKAVGGVKFRRILNNKLREYHVKSNCYKT